MLTIPQNDSAALEAKQEAEHQAELDRIGNQFLRGLKKNDYATVECEEHMVGRYSDFHHLCDTLEVARMFAKKGYYCYYYDFYNNHGVNQRGVTVRKTRMPESERRSPRGSLEWYVVNS